ncbi:methyltransferase domain-containing protein [bacterium]|nr:methyltransferase domain-containing protein [bacterium]
MADALETYTHGHHESVVSQHRKRTAAEAARFLLPHLRPGMRLLDVGCGPGSISVGLAAAVAPGPVLAIDLGADVVAQARERAATEGAANLRVEQADVLSLDRPGGFDVVYAHQVLQHVADPLAVLGAMRRLLASGGIVALRDSDYGICTWNPAADELTRWLEVYRAVARRNGGEPDAGRHLYGWVKQAGFTDPQVSGTTWTFPGYESPRLWAESWAERTLHSNLAAKAVAYGIADRAELQWIADGLRRWGQLPDAFFSIGHVEVLARRS